MNYLKWAGLIFIIAVFGISTTAAQQEISPREQFKTIDNYVVYYGEGRADELAQFDLAIIQPETLIPDELADLTETSDTLLIAYLSIGEVEPWRTWYSDGSIQSEWILEENPIWKSYYIDANQAGWRDFIVAKAQEYLDLGFDGIFLDTVDTVDLYPDTQPGMIQMIADLRAAYPDAILIQNRGMAVAEDTAATVDAIMWEDLSTTYNFDTETYEINDSTAEIEQLTTLRDDTGVIILALDYAAADDAEGAQKAMQIAREYGFIPSVSVILLDDIPAYMLPEPEATPS